MKGYFSAVVLILLFGWFPSLASGAYLEDGSGGDHHRQSSPTRPYLGHPDEPLHPFQPPFRKPFPCCPEATFAQRMDSLSVGWPWVHKQMILYPLLGRDIPSPHFCSLNDAMAKGWLWIEETGDASSLWGCNRSGEYMFLMVGQIVAGGWQNRSLSSDVILGPWMERIRLPVFCVEKGRWDGRHTSFVASPGSSPSSLRKRLAGNATQTEIWDEVDRVARHANSRNHTQDLSQTLMTSPYLSEVNEYIETFRNKVLPGHCVGMMVFCGDRFVGVDLFATNRLFKDMRDDLVGGYAWEMLGQRPSWWKKPGRIQAQQILRRIRESRVSGTSTTGEGTGLLLRGDKIQGSGIIFQDGLIHLHVW